VLLTISVSLPAPARIVVPWMAPANVSAPPAPLTVIVSVPEVQVGKVQPDRSADPPESTLTTIALVELVPVMIAADDILPAPNWLALKVAVDVPAELAKRTPSTLTKPFTPSAAAALRSTATAAVVAPTWMTSLPAPPSYRSPIETWLVAPTTKRSIWLVPTMLSLPVEPVRLIVSVPEAQVTKVRPDRSSELPAARFTAKPWTPAAVPVTVAAADILPAPNWLALKVAVDVVDVLTKERASMFTKPSTPSLAAAVRLTATPAPTVPICSVSVSPPPS
jgi:hypothetical protein